MGNVPRTVSGLESFWKRHHVVDRCGKESDIKVGLH